MKAVAVRMGVLPVQRFIRGLERRRFDLSEARALEVYGSTGERLTIYYADRVKSLEVWEIEPSFEPVLRENLPAAEIKITDSHEEIRRTTRRYDLIIVDNPSWPLEHFELFPAVLDRLSDSAVLELFVFTGANAVTRRVYPHMFGDEHLERRRAFYGTDRPERIRLNELVAHYAKLCRAAGLHLEWWFAICRWTLVGGLPRPTETYNLALKVTRASAPAAASTA